MKTVLIMAGGTGGHIIPALAVAKVLIDRGATVSWIGSQGGLEEKLVGAAGIPIDVIEVKGIRHSGWKRKLSTPLMLGKAVHQSIRIFRKRKPDVVLGMGGFVAGPGGIAALMKGVPMVLHEQNTVAGMTNRWLAKLTKQVLSGFPEAQGIREFEWIGNPVRKDILDLPSPKERLSDRSGALRILVVGGSQGAQVFNEHLPRVLGKIPNCVEKVWHQCGKNDEAPIQAAYDENGVLCDVSPFIQDMASAYGWADVVICRSGAMTVSEICGAGLAAIFVPYPFAVNDHQTKNADYLVREKAGHTVQQQEFMEGDWITILEQWVQDRRGLEDMSVKARSLAKSLAAQQAADRCMEVANA